MTLIWNLLMGGRMGRYTGFPDTLVLDQRVELRGFSAGSFAGLSTLQLLWKIPNVVTEGKLGQLLAHRNCWSLHQQLMLSIFCTMSQINYVCGVSTEGPAYLEQGSTAIRIGSSSISRQAGGTLPGFSSCTPMLRAPLRGMPRPCDYSSGSAFVWKRLEALLEETMLYLSTAEKVRETDLLALGTKHLDMGTPFESAEELRDHLIELVSVRA